jgi:RNA polymerase sigma-70 factor (ECF subfamily)
VRLCARLTGAPDAAEDLAQETLLAAWQTVDALRDPAARDAWLDGIARNLSRNWLRTRGRERAHLTPDFSASDAELGTGAEPLDRLAGAFDLEVELERDELADLVARALSLLPAPTRRVLVERYIKDAPQAAVAARLGLSETAVAVRVHRGKLALRQVLATAFADEAAVYGLPTGDMTGGWRETRLWCPECGVRHLIGRLAVEGGPGFQLRCPACHAAPGVYFSNAPRDRFTPDLLGVTGFKRTLDRLMAWGGDFYPTALDAGAMACPRCGGAMPVRRRMPDDGPPSLRGQLGAAVRCAACGWEAVQGLGGLVLALPEARAFWRTHPRIRWLPWERVEAEGGPAIVTRFASLRGAGRLDVVVARDTLRVLRVHASAGE